MVFVISILFGWIRYINFISMRKELWVLMTMKLLLAYNLLLTIVSSY